MSQIEEKKLVKKLKSLGMDIIEIEDSYRGRGWNKYLLNEWYIWICSKGWAKARFDEVYVDHSYYSSLEEAFLSAHTGR